MLKECCDVLERVAHVLAVLSEPSGGTVDNSGNGIEDTQRGKPGSEYAHGPTAGTIVDLGTSPIPTPSSAPNFPPVLDLQGVVVKFWTMEANR